jgi:hypothetical protein
MAPSACARDDSSLFIRGCVDVPRDTCVVDVANPLIPLLFGGSMDAAYVSEYQCVALVENQLVPRGDANKLRTETSRVELYQADVQVLNTNNPPQVINRGAAGAAQFSVPITGFVDPSMGTDPGIGAASVIMLDFATVQALASAAVATNTQQMVQVSVIIRGRTLGGLEVHTNEFLYPINLCNGCLCSVPVGSPCIGGSEKPAENCRLGLDAAVDCRFLGCGQLECPDGTLTSAQCPAKTGQPDPAQSCCGLGP